MKTLATIFKIKKGKKIVDNKKKGYTAVCTFKPSKQIKWHDEIETDGTSPKPKHVQGDHTNHHLVLDTIIKEKQKRSKEERCRDKETRHRINCNRFEQLFLRLKKQGNGEPILSNQQLHSVEEVFRNINNRKRKRGAERKKQKISANKKILIGLYKTLVLNNCLIKKGEKKSLDYEEFHNKKMDSFWKKRDRWFEELLTKTPISESDRMERLAAIKQEKEELRAAKRKWMAAMNNKNTIKSLTHADYIEVKNNNFIKKWKSCLYDQVEKCLKNTSNLTEEQLKVKLKEEEKIIDKQAIDKRSEILDSMPSKKEKKVKEVAFSPSIDYVVTVVKDDYHHGVVLEMKSAKSYIDATNLAQSLHDKWFDSPFCKKPKITGWTYVTERYSIYKDPITGILVNKPGKRKSQILMTSSEIKRLGIKAAA